MDGNYQDLITTAKQHRNIWGISQAHGLSLILRAIPYSSAGDFRGGKIVLLRYALLLRKYFAG